MTLLLFQNFLLSLPHPEGWVSSGTLNFYIELVDLEIKKGLRVLSQRLVQGIVAQKESFHLGTQEEEICGEWDA